MKQDYNRRKLVSRREKDMYLHSQGQDQLQHSCPALFQGVGSNELRCNTTPIAAANHCYFISGNQQCFRAVVTAAVGGIITICYDLLPLQMLVLCSHRRVVVSSE